MGRSFLDYWHAVLAALGLDSKLKPPPGYQSDRKEKPRNAPRRIQDRLAAKSSKCIDSVISYSSPPAETDAQPRGKKMSRANVATYRIAGLAICSLLMFSCDVGGGTGGNGCTTAPPPPLSSDASLSRLSAAVNGIGAFKRDHIVIPVGAFPAGRRLCSPDRYDLVGLCHC